MGKEVKSKKYWVTAFVVIGFLFIGIQLFTNIAEMNEKDECLFDEQEILIDTAKEMPDSTLNDEGKDSVWKDTEFMQ